MLSLETKYLTVEYQEENAMLITRWSPESEYLDDTTFQEQILLWLNKLKELRPKNLLIDTTKFGFVIVPELQQWFDDKVFTAYPEIGIQKKAFLMSKDIFIQVSVEQATDDAQNLSVEVKHFDDEQEAIHWLNA